MTTSLSARDARRIALHAQGFAKPRPSRAHHGHLTRLVDQVGLIQIDAVNVLVRSQELPLFARFGEHRRDLIPAATNKGFLFEYWGHALSHIRSQDHRLYRWRMREFEQRIDIEPAYLEQIFERVATGGAVLAADLSERVGKKGPWWDWDRAKLALEVLFRTGQLTAQRRDRDFARIYDLPERMIPAEHLAAPTPPEPDARRELLSQAARALGVATARDLAQYHRQSAPAARPLVRDLVEAGELEPVQVEGWREPAYLHASAPRRPRAIEAASFVSPFDSLCWERDRLARVFGFDYKIEIYVPPPQRRYGYFVLPFVLGDRFVARADLKADRQAGALAVRSAWSEPGIDTAATAEAMAAELRSMASWLGLDDVTVDGPGDLVGALRAANATARRR